MTRSTVFGALGCAACRRRGGRSRRGERELDGLEVAHLADEDDVGSSRSARAARANEWVCMPTSRWLTSILATVHELDRILDGKNVHPRNPRSDNRIIAASVVDLPSPLGR
jgi:hypothetical protein